MKKRKRKEGEWRKMGRKGNRGMRMEDTRE